MNTVWWVVILGLEVLLVSGTCRNPHVLTDDIKVCNDWWLEAMDRSDVRDFSRVRRCMNMIIKRCPSALTIVMTAQKEGNGKKRLRIRVDATHESFRTTIFYLVSRSRGFCLEPRGMEKNDLCSFYKQVDDLVDWSEKEKQYCHILMEKMEFSTNN